MSDNRSVARGILEEAIDTITAKRPGVHGSAENSFAMTGELWATYLRHCKAVRGNDTILPEDVAEMMALLKKARKVYGDTLNRDNDVDDAGYTALAGMLRLPDPEQQKTTGEQESERCVPRMTHTGIDTRSLKERLIARDNAPLYDPKQKWDVGGQ